MIKVKQLFDEVEDDDGHRLWIEPIGLTTDLREWCKVDGTLQAFSPPKKLWFWFDEHPDDYDYFRAQVSRVAGPGADAKRTVEAGGRVPKGTRSRCCTRAGTRRRIRAQRYMSF